MSIQITLPDGAVREYEAGITALEIAKAISEGLARNVVAAKINGEVCDATRPILQSARLVLLTFNDVEGKKVFWHSTAHLLAEALESLYPKVKFGTGPAIENGFYYDVDMGEKGVLSSHDFPQIEAKMLELAKRKNPYIRTEVSKQYAVDFFAKKGDEYKLELLENLQDGDISFYQQGDFVDLCKGSHLPTTEPIKAIKLLNIASAYWRADESRNTMTRIYGISFPKDKDLKEYLQLLEEAKKRDHRKLGAELELFMFSERVGAGLPIWLPKGTALRTRLEDFLKKEQQKRGYQLVITPHIGGKNLYVTSGHYEKYGKDSFQPINTPREGETFLLKPMNCPHHCEIFAHRPRSYKDLPIRIAEFGTVYRYEQAGELHGLSRVRCFTQDDAHLFCTAAQVKGEFLNVLGLTLLVFQKMGFKDYTAQISLRDPASPEKYIGSDENWAAAELAIIEAAAESGLKTTTALGEAAFYGPKLDFMVKDALGRSWQLGTIQVDYNLPERFDLTYTGTDGQAHRPVMIHRAPFGSMERFISVLIEHTAGRFPLWLAPEQAIILPISEKFMEYSQQVAQFLETKDIRATIDERAETTGRKIRDAEMRKIPIMLIVGEKEAETQTISVRLKNKEQSDSKDNGDKGAMTWGDFADLFQNLLDTE